MVTCTPKPHEVEYDFVERKGKKDAEEQTRRSMGGWMSANVATLELNYKRLLLSSNAVRDTTVLCVLANTN